MSVTNQYDIGSLVRISATFTLASGVEDPSTITAKVKLPNGTTTTYVYGTDGALVRDSKGVYHVDWSVTAAGVHQYRFVGTGTAQGAASGSFLARESNL